MALVLDQSKSGLSQVNRRTDRPSDLMASFKTSS